MMTRWKTYLSGLILFSVTNCGQSRKEMNCISKGVECNAESTRSNQGGESDGGISNGNGKSPSTTIIGPQGPGGSSCTVEQVTTGARISCSDGTSAVVSSGTNGSNGTNGTNGSNGANGGSCSVYQASNGARISCPDGTEVVVLNGVDGTDGQDGSDGSDGSPGAPAPATPYTVVEIIDPCGAQGSFDEVILRLANGDLLAHYSHGSKQHLVLIGPGSYETTDGTKCRFTVSSTKQITW